jgi:hypothetical protein
MAPIDSGRLPISQQQLGAFVCASERREQQLSLELEQFKFIAEIISQSWLTQNGLQKESAQKCDFFFGPAGQ